MFWSQHSYHYLHPVITTLLSIPWTLSPGKVLFSAVPVTGFAGEVVFGIPSGAAFWRKELLWDAKPGSEL